MEETDRTLLDSLIGLMRQAGIEVITDVGEAERVLDQVNFLKGGSKLEGLIDNSDVSISFSLIDSVNSNRMKSNQHYIKDRNELSIDDKEIQQKAWRAVFHSLSEDVSPSEMPRHTKVPGTSYSASKPIVGANLGKISGIYDQLNILLREINDNFARESCSGSLA